MIPIYPSKRPPASFANWHLFNHIYAHETWKGNCPEIKIYRDRGNDKTYFPHYYKVAVNGKTKYFFGERAEMKVNQYLFDLGADTTI